MSLGSTQNVLRTQVCKGPINLTEIPSKISGLSSCFRGPSRHRQPQLSTSIHLLQFVRLFVRDFSSPPLHPVSPTQLSMVSTNFLRKRERRHYDGPWFNFRELFSNLKTQNDVFLAKHKVNVNIANETTNSS